MKTFILAAFLLVHAVVAPASGQSAYLPGDPSGLAAWRESLRDDETLKACLGTRLWGDNDVVYEGWTPWDMALWFRRDAGGLEDERLHKALVEIYREAESQTGRDAKDLMTRVALWLGVCADDATKAFLLEVAGDKTKDGFLRGTAVASYLRIADAEEAKDALIRFLVGGERLDDMTRLALYQNAQMAWHETESVEKKAAILAALYAALSVESPPWVFRVGDQIVREMSPRYAASKERLVLLEKALARPFPERRERTKLELESRLKEMRKLKVLASVSTNLAVLRDRDFNQPLPEEERIALMTHPIARQAANAPQEEQPQTARTDLYAFGGAAAAALAAVGAWLFIRRRKASRP